MGSKMSCNFVPGLKAGADLSTKQYYLVKLDTSTGDIILADANAVCMGVLQNNPTLGEFAEVAWIAGGANVIAGGAITIGATVMSDANGKAVVTTAAGDNIIGTATKAAVLDDIVPIVIEKYTRHA